jgi:hypothetical protein
MTPYASRLAERIVERFAEVGGAVLPEHAHRLIAETIDRYTDDTRDLRGAPNQTMPLEDEPLGAVYETTYGAECREWTAEDLCAFRENVTVATRCISASGVPKSSGRVTR